MVAPSTIYLAKHTKGSIVDIEVTEDELSDVSEYGFGFWM